MSNLTTEELPALMTQYQVGDGKALEGLYSHLSKGLFGYLYRYTNDREMAEDLLQEVFLKVHRVRHTYNASKPVKPWFYAIARYTAIDAIRKRGRQKETPCQDSVLDARAGSDMEKTQA